MTATENTTGTLTLAGNPTGNLALDFLGRYTSTRKDFDTTDFGTGLPGDSGDETDVDLGYFRGGDTEPARRSLGTVATDGVDDD